MSTTPAPSSLDLIALKNAIVGKRDMATVLSMLNTLIRQAQAAEQ